jgi:DNA-binding response OmpR family regulator
MSGRIGGREAMEQRTFGPARNVSPQSLRGLHDDGATPDVPTPKRWEFEGFTLDLAGRTLTDAFGKEVLLWRSEFALLLAFLRAPGHALTREHLLNAVSGRDAAAFDRSIDVLVGRRLRSTRRTGSKLPPPFGTAAHRSSRDLGEASHQLQVTT